MKNRYKIVLGLGICLAFASCDKFLEETSKDQIIPETVADYSEFIFGEVYKKRNDKDIHTYLDIMTDDCEDWAKKSSFGADTRNYGFGYYAWQAEPEYPLEGALSSDAAWAHYYHQILMCNIVLYELDDATGTHEDRERLRAECYMLRAYAYYTLVNLYGKPYDPATAATEMGVPINDLLGAVNQNFKRSSVAEVYSQITSDIENALKAFAQAGKTKSIYRWNVEAAYVFASRVALYMQNWEDAVTYATKAITASPKLWNLEEKNGSDQAAFFFSKGNPEILFSYGYYYVTYFATGAKGAFPTSASLKAMYATGDLRYGNTNGHFVRNQGSILFGGGKRYVQYKYEDSSTTGVFGSAIRNAEAYLNRAEAYSQQGELQDAISDLNTIRKQRLTAATYADLTYTDQADVIQKVRDERRRELCFEQHRWFDLRRWDRPRIVHTFTPVLGDATTTVTYVLEENDPAYTLPIPKEVLQKDAELVDIQRPERNPVKAE